MNYLNYFVSNTCFTKFEALTQLNPMKRTLLWLISMLSILFLNSCSAPSCADIKNGKFKLTDHETGYIYIVMREGNLQKEIDPIEKDTSVFLVEWNGECNYSLALKSGSETEQNFMQNRKLMVKVLEVNRNYYIFSSKIENEELEIIDTLFKLQP